MSLCVKPLMSSQIIAGRALNPRQTALSRPRTSQPVAVTMSQSAPLSGFVRRSKLQLTGVGRISYCLAPLERAKTGWRGFGTGQNTLSSPAFGHAVLLPLKGIQAEKIHQLLEIS